MEYDISDSDDELQIALGEALGEEPRSHELRQMQESLQARYALLMNELAIAEESERPKLAEQLSDLEEKISVLGEEAQITRFIEDAVRVSLEVRRLDSS